MSRPVLTPEQVAEIGRVYDGRSETIDALVRKFGCRRHNITSTARRLGATKTTRRAWLTTEDRYLRENWARVPVAEMAQKLGRTVQSLTNRKKRLGLSTWSVADEIGYSVRELEQLTSIDHRYWVEMMEAGELRHVVLQTFDAESVTRVTRIQDLHRFLRRHPEWFDYRGAPVYTRLALELDRLPDPPRFKQVTCRSRNQELRLTRQVVGRKVHHGDIQLEDRIHAPTSMASCADKPFSFWVPTYESSPTCPRCGCKVTRVSESRRYRDDAPGDEDILRMLAGKLGLRYRDGTVLDATGDPVSPERLLEYAFNTNRNPAKAYGVFRRLLAAGMAPMENQAVPTTALAEPVTDYALRDRQQQAWEAFLRCSNIGVYWPPGEGKMFFAAYALTRICGRHLLFVNSTTLTEQWVDFLEQHCAGGVRSRRLWNPSCRKIEVLDESGAAVSEISIFTYRTRAPFEDRYDLVVYDEMHWLPGNNAHRLALIDSRYRIGLTATPFREDGRGDILELVTGQVIGEDWTDILDDRQHAIAQVRVLVIEDLEEKHAVLPSLLEDGARTLIFADALEDGHRISAQLGLPFVHGETNDRLEAVRQHQQLVISRVGDHGLDITDLARVVEFSFHHGSRTQELQRYGRLLHSTEAQEHVILMTRKELSLYSKRLTALESKGFRISIELHAGELPSRKELLRRVVPGMQRHAA